MFPLIISGWWNRRRSGVCSPNTEPDNTDTSLSVCQSPSGRPGCRCQQEEEPAGRQSRTPETQTQQLQRFSHIDLKAVRRPWADDLPRRSGRRAGRGCCGAEPECRTPSGCGTSRPPPSQNAERSPRERGVYLFDQHFQEGNLQPQRVSTSGWMQRFFLDDSARARKLLTSPVSLA